MDRRNMRPWKLEELENLITWMEENHEVLRGKPADWVNKVKEEVFSDNEHVTVKKLKDKYTNMKKAWKDAKAMQEQSGFGLKEEDCERSINEKLNKKCIHFWRLDAIWGHRPNNKPVITVDTLQLSSTGFMDEPEDDDNGGAEESPESQPKPKRGGKSPGKVESDGDSDDGQGVPIRRGKSKARGTSTQHGRGGAGEGLKRLLEASEARKEARDEKRIKAEMEVQMHRIESERATAERVAEIQARSNTTAERVAEIQARSNETMAKMQQETMSMQMRMMEGFFKTMQGHRDGDATA